MLFRAVTCYEIISKLGSREVRLTALWDVKRAEGLLHHSQGRMHGMITASEWVGDDRGRFHAVRRTRWLALTPPSSEVSSAAPSRCRIGRIRCSRATRHCRWIEHCYDLADRNRDGFLTFSEIVDLLKKMNVGLEKRVVKALFKVSTVVAVDDGCAMRRARSTGAPARDARRARWRFDQLAE